MIVLPAHIYRYAEGPAALIYVARVMKADGVVYGMACSSGHPLTLPLRDVRALRPGDMATWADHDAFRAPYEGHFTRMIEEREFMDDISIDCETLGTENNCAIVAIGAVQFNISTGKFGKTFYERIAIDDAIRHGSVSADTIAWWVLKANDAARKEIFEAHSNENTKAARASDVLHRFHGFMKGCSPAPKPWFNGPSEDGAWIKNMIRSACPGMTLPWAYNAPNDLRTAVRLSGLDVKTIPDADGPRHHALSDAKWQAAAIVAAFKRTASARKAATTVVDDDEL